MTDAEISAVAVIEDSRIVGIISERDVTRAVAEETDPSTATASQ
jgi:CBS domain-containing protein